MWFKKINDLIAPIRFVDYSDIRFVEKASKLRMVTYLAFLLNLTCLGIILARAVFLNAPLQTTYPMFAILVFSLGSYLYIRQSKNLSVGIFLVELIFYVAIPLRVYQTGGVSSPAIYAYIFHVMLAYALRGRRYGFAVFIWSTICLGAFVYIDVPVALAKTGGYYAFFCFLILLANVAVMNNILKEKEFVSRSATSLEKQRQADIILERMAHEVGNSLNISQGYFKAIELQDKSQKQFLELGLGRLQEIDRLIKSMYHLNDKEKLVELLEEFERETRILEKVEERVKSINS